MNVTKQTEVTNKIHNAKGCNIIMSNEVQPIRETKYIKRMKNALHGRNKLLFILGINTGLRVSDLLNLKVKDVLTAKGTAKASIKVTEKKTKKTRNIMLNRSVKAALKESEIKYSEDAYLFASRKGSEAISRVQAYRILNEAAKKCGIKDDIGTHTLRKTWAYHAYKNGTDLSILMKALNHSSQSVTLRYIGITKEQIEDVYINVCL